MYVEKHSEEKFCIYINNQYFASLDWDNKEEISRNVKKLLFRLNQIYHLSLSGFYKMVIYLNKKVGMMIELNRLEDFGVDIKTIDLRIVIYLNSDFFIEVDDLELLQEIDEIYYYQNHFYGNVDYFLEEQFLSITEWGRFIYGDRVDDIKRKGKQIHLK